MRAWLFCFVLASAVMAGRPAAQQPIPFRTPNPDRVAVEAEWQINSEPIVAAGLTYYPTRETRLFDGQVMTQIDVYEGVPVYADMSITPFTLAFVPLTRTRMRTYERLPEDGRWVISGRGRSDVPVVGTTGSARGAALAMESPRAATVSGMDSIPPPRGTGGVWVEFAGERWYSNGAAESFEPTRFVLAGDYHGFAVYRDKAGAAGRIWITTVPGGPLAPYARR